MSVFKTSENVVSKSISRTKWILKETFKTLKYYGFKISWYSLLWWIGWYGHMHKVAMYALNKLTVRLDLYIINNYKNIISKYLNNEIEDKNDLNNNKESEYTVWTFWWQGEEAMPELVKTCVNSLKSRYKNVVLITKDNMQQYVDIPQIIYEKVHKGIITYTHFSDILRVSLLAKYGGMWCDATCFMHKPFMPDVTNLAFYSCNSKVTYNLPLWSNSRWCGWNMGTSFSNNQLFLFVRDMLYAINEQENCIPHYLLIDYLIDYAYRNIPGCKEFIDSCPEYNTHRAKLQFLLNSPFDQCKWMNITKGENEFIFKLSYKSPYKESVDNKSTFYYKLISKEL